jgi:hypothetical protein
VSHPNDESDRKHVRHNPTPTAKDQRLRFGKSVSDDDVQAGSECSQRLEKTPRSQHLKDLLRGVRFIDGENEHTLKEKKRSSENNPSKETVA